MVEQVGQMKTEGLVEGTGRRGGEGGVGRTTSCLGVNRVLRERGKEGKVFVAGGGGGGEEDEAGGGSEAVSSRRGRLAGGGAVVGEELAVTEVSNVEE